MNREPRIARLPTLSVSSKNWNALAFAILALIIWEAFIAPFAGFWTGPIMMLIIFVAEHYSAEIDMVAKRLKTLMRGIYAGGE